MVSANPGFEQRDLGGMIMTSRCFQTVLEDGYDDVHYWIISEGKGTLGANAMKRVAACAYLPTPWLSEPPKTPDDSADYSLDCSFLH